jgi:hypothetical protein
MAFALISEAKLGVQPRGPFAARVPCCAFFSIYGGTSEIMKTIIAREVTGLQT